jgi:hypothetical protein
MSPARSGIASETPNGAGMSAGTTTFAKHLRSRCAELGTHRLAEALDRLEEPSEETMRTGLDEGDPSADLMDIPFEEMAA